MASRKKRFHYQSLHDSKTIQALLKDIVAGIARGKLTFSDDEEKIVMKPEGLLELRVTAAQEEGRNRFNIKVSWQQEERHADRKKTLYIK